MANYHPHENVSNQNGKDNDKRNRYSAVCTLLALSLVRVGIA